MLRWFDLVLKIAFTMTYDDDRKPNFYKGNVIIVLYPKLRSLSQNVAIKIISFLLNVITLNMLLLQPISVSGKLSVIYHK